MGSGVQPYIHRMAGIKLSGARAHLETIGLKGGGHTCCKPSDLGRPLDLEVHRDTAVRCIVLNTAKASAA